MVNKTRNVNLQKLVPIILILIFSILLFISFFDNQIKFDELALNKEAEKVHEKIDNQNIICSGFKDYKDCINLIKKKDKKEIILYLGNSQINSINQKKEEDHLVSYYLFDKLKEKKKIILTFVLPNGSITEHLIIYEYISNIVNVDKLIVSLVFDDFREGNIRKDISDFLKEEKFVEVFNKSKHKKKIYKQINYNKKTNKGGVKSPQIFFEKKITDYLDTCCDYESKRSYASKTIYLKLYILRNYVFNINPTTKRKIIPSAYEKNINSFEDLIISSKRNNTKIYSYIAPIRQDVGIPYVKHEYEMFKSDINKLSNKHSAEFENFENLIPNNLWGTKPATKIGGKNEIDFMHFQGPAHKILSNKILEIIGESK